MRKNYCGNFGCKNCEWFRRYPSNNYYEPDDYDCVADSSEYFKEVNKTLTYSDEELEEILDRVYCDGEEWDNADEQICPYYRYYTIDEKIF